MAGTATIAPSCAVQLVESKSIAGRLGARPARAPPLFRRTSGWEGRFPGGQPPRSGDRCPPDRPQVVSIASLLTVGPGRRFEGMHPAIPGRRVGGRSFRFPAKGPMTGNSMSKETSEGGLAVSLVLC